MSNRNKKLILFILNNRTFILVIAVAIIAACFSKRFLSGQNLINVLRQVSSYTILGMGFTFVLASGNIDLSVGSMVSLVGIVTGLVSKIPGMPFVGAILTGVFVGIVCGLTNGSISTFFRLPAFVVTLAMSEVYKGIAFLLCNNAPVTRLPETFKVIGAGSFIGLPIPVWIMFIVVSVFATIMYKTKFGRHVIAKGGNADAARVCGISIERVNLTVYAMLGLCVSIATVVLIGRAFSAQPSAGQGMEMDTIAAVVIGGTALRGGIGNVYGTIFGCLMIGIINNMLNLAAIDSNWQYIAKGFLIVLAILIDVQTEKVYNKISLSKTT